MSLSCPFEDIPACRERLFDGSDLSFDENLVPEPPKHFKSSTAEFHDCLSKLWLTSRALKEFNRRTPRTRPGRPPPVPQPVDQESLKQIQRFARHGGPDCRDLQGCPYPADYDPTYTMPSDSQPSNGEPRKSPTPPDKRSSAWDKNFEQHFIDHHIYPAGYRHRDDRQTPEPELDNLYQRLQKPRESVSRFTLSDFRDFQRKNEEVISKGKVMKTLIPIIHGETDIPNEVNLQFTRLESMTNRATVDPKPDMYDGARLNDIDSKVQQALGPYVIPTRHTAAPVAPNFFVETKAPKGSVDVVKRQAMQDGAYGARAMHSLQSYSEGKPVYDGTAHTIVSTYHAGPGTLKLYATHPTQGENGPEYHTTQVNGWDLTGNFDSFRQGVTAFRNARDWSQEQRDKFIKAANGRAGSATSMSTRPEGTTYSNWLATLNEAEESPAPASDQDTTLPSAAPSDVNGLVDETGPSSHLDSSTKDSPVQTNHGQPSVDSLALDSDAPPATPNKRKRKISIEAISQEEGLDHGGSSSHHPSKRRI